jgi:hypothetical protein
MLLLLLLLLLLCLSSSLLLLLLMIFARCCHCCCCSCSCRQCSQDVLLVFDTLSWGGLLLLHSPLQGVLTPSRPAHAESNKPNPDVFCAEALGVLEHFTCMIACCCFRRLAFDYEFEFELHSYNLTCRLHDCCTSEVAFVEHRLAVAVP